MKKIDNPSQMNDIEYGNLQDRKFTCILYPDATNYAQTCQEILDYRLTCGFFSEWFYILHDKDLNDDGTLKKPHYHVVVTKSNPSTIKIISKQLGIPQNYIQRVSNLKGMIKYLTHDEIQDKIKYDKKEIVTNVPDFVYRSYSVDTDAEKGKEIIDYIIDNNITSITDLAVWASNSGYYSAFRRGFAVFSCIVRENCVKG